MPTEQDKPPQFSFGSVPLQSDWIEPVFRALGMTYDTGSRPQGEPDPVPLIVPADPQLPGPRN